MIVLVRFLMPSVGDVRIACVVVRLLRMQHQVLKPSIYHIYDSASGTTFCPRAVCHVEGHILQYQ